MIESYVDKIYIINLDERTDRWKHVQNEMKKLGIKNYTRFSAIKPPLEEIPKEYYNKYRLAGRDHNKYIQACTGSKLSQIAVMTQANSANLDKILIVQDDAMFIDNADEIFNKAIEQLEDFEWDILYLTGNHVQKPGKVSENLVRLTGSYSSLAYITKKYIRDIYIDEALKSGKEMDVFARQNIHPVYRCYCIYPSLAWDMPGYSDVLQGNRNYENVFNRKFSWDK